MAADYEDFRERMATLEKFIGGCDTKEIDGEVHITIDENNVDEFTDIVQSLLTVATSEDGYVDEVLQYLTEINTRLTDRNMIAKVLHTFVAMECLATMTTLPDPNEEVRFDDWVLEISNKEAHFQDRFGKVVGIDKLEDGKMQYRVRAPLASEVIEWEDPCFVIIPNMERVLKVYQDRYTKIF